MKLDVLKYPHTALKTKCSEFKFTAPADAMQQLETDMIDTMLAYNGIGLAANQVGILERFLAIQLQTTLKCLVMYNPEIIDTVEDAKITSNEGCLSFPRVRLDIARHPTIVVRYQDKNQAVFTEQFNGIDAVCLQHEIDHLDGTVFKDHVSELKYQRAVKRAK